MVAFGNGIGEHTHAVVADHTIGLITGQFPYRQTPALLIHVEHAVDKLLRALGLGNGIQRVRRSIGIPKTEHSIMSVHGIAINDVVLSAVAAIYITPKIWNGIGMIQCSGKDGTLIR